MGGKAGFPYTVKADCSTGDLIQSSAVDLSCTGSTVKPSTTGTPGELWPRDCTREGQEGQTWAKHQCDPACGVNESQLKTAEVTSCPGHNQCLHAGLSTTRATGRQRGLGPHAGATLAWPILPVFSQRAAWDLHVTGIRAASIKGAFPFPPLPAQLPAWPGGRRGPMRILK